MKDKPLEELKFKHLPINRPFVHRCDLFIKISKSMAVGIYTTSKRRFKKDTSVCLLKKIKLSSFTEGRSEGSWDKIVAEEWAENVINKFNGAGHD